MADAALNIDQDQQQPDTGGGQQPPQQPTLAPEQRTKLDGIVVQMYKQNATKDEIQSVVDDFKKKYSTAPTQPEHAISEKPSDTAAWNYGIEDPHSTIQKVTDSPEFNKEIDKQTNAATMRNFQKQKEIAEAGGKIDPSTIPFPLKLPDQIKQDRDVAKSDPRTVRNTLATVIRNNKGKDISNSASKAAYAIDAGARNANPTAVKYNMDQMNAGRYHYDPSTGKVVINGNFLDNVFGGMKYHSDMMDANDFLTSHNEQDNINYLEEKRKDYDPDKAVKEYENTFGGMIGQGAVPILKMEGPTLLETIPGAGQIAGAALTTLGMGAGSMDFAQTSHASTLINNYNQYRQNGDDEKTALTKASSDANLSGALAFAQGLILGGGKPAEYAPVRYGQGFKKVMTDVANNSKEALAHLAPEVAKPSGAAGLAQAIENAHQGKPIDENVFSTMAHMAVFAGTLGLLRGVKDATAGARANILDGAASAPPQKVDEALNTFAFHGNITPEKAVEIKDEIDAHTVNSEGKLDIHSPLTPEGEQALKDVENGGVPAFMTNNLRKIAKDNGIEIEKETGEGDNKKKTEISPNEVINQLKKKQESAKYPETFTKKPESKVSVIRPEENKPPNIIQPEHTISEQSTQGIQTDKDLRTLNYGDFKGQKEDQAAKDQINKDIINDDPIGKSGERFSEFIKRAIPAVDKVIEDPDENSVLVTHSSVLRAMKVWNEMGKPDVNNLKPEQLKEFAEKYVNTKPEKEGEVEVLHGKNGTATQIVRHGETEDNKVSDFRDDNTELTDKGQQQAQKSAEQIKQMTGGNIAKIVASDLPRTLHTANIINENVKPTEQHAIQERSPEEVLQREQGETTSAGGGRGRMEPSQQGGIPAGEGGQQPTTQEKGEAEGKEENPELTNISKAINDARIEGKFGTDALDRVVSKLQDTKTKNIYEKVRDRIKSGLINTKNVRERVMTTQSGSEEDQAALLYDLADLKGKENELQKAILSESDADKIKDLQKQLMDNQNEQMDNALANRAIGRSASNIFNIRQLWVNREMTIADMRDQYMASKGVKELTQDQEKQIKAHYDEIQQLKQDAVKAKAELDKATEENARLKEENKKLKELKDKSTEQKKKDRSIRSDEAIAKSNERIGKAKNALKDINSELSVSLLPFNPKAAVEIAKIAAEKVYQGVVKFDELVKNVLDEIKDVLPNWTKEDVTNHLLTSVDKNGALSPTLLSERYLKSKELAKTSDKNLREKVAAYESAQKAVANKQFEWQKDRRMDMMANRPLKERIIDSVLRWQRFAVLSYPTTFVKLLGVVAHQLTLKPLKFAIQKLVSAVTPKSVTSKQSIWGNPEWQSLGKYYSSFIRNFALSNLKEHFKGIDTKELLYGKPMMYDEWNAAKGLLDMPGRSHGYIKSFIKNPEFQYAHEQQMAYHLGQMADIQKQLDAPNLSEEKRTELKSEYDKHDVTNEDVMERINKLSLEHGKWAIMMNENKFADKFRHWTGENGITGALLKSEAPVLKIPLNYVGRAFATKYGLIQAMIGKGKDMPSVFKLMKDGTRDLTEDQANLLGRTLSIGTMGASFFALGYMNRKNIKENQDGSLEVFGHHVSKYLTHSPEFDSIISGASTANGQAKEKEKNKDALHWIKNFAESDIDIAKKSPFASMLQYGFIPNVATALISKKDNDTKLNKVEDAAFRKISDMATPGFLKQSAQWTDTKDKGIHPMEQPKKRVPKGNELERFWQTMELGIPGLRKNVPIKHTRQ